MTKQDKIYFIIGSGLLFTSYQLLAKGKNVSSQATNMNKNLPDTKENRGGVTYAVFNQNPLNVKVQKDKNGQILQLYPGEISVSGAVHKMFDTWTNGTAAAMIHLWRYLNGKVTGDVYPSGTPLNTIEKIIRTWAPISDPSNDTEGYIQFIEKALGMSRTAVIPFQQTPIINLVRAMSVREDRAAAQFVTDDILLRGWNVANAWLKAIKGFR